MHQLNTFNLDFVTCMFRKYDWKMMESGEHFVEKVYKFIRFKPNQQQALQIFTK